jgi:hypothetical protein
MNNPVQIILDPKSFIFTPDRPVGGGNTDFYAEKDDDFIKHKKLLKEKTKLMAKQLGLSRFGDLGVLKVDLKNDALAKSHHPIQSLYPSHKTPEIGAGEVSSLYFQVDSSSLMKTIDSIDKSEVETRYKYDKKLKKNKPNPSRIRSEIGAIQDISLYNEGDRLKFGAKHAVDWLKQDNTWKCYIIELFDYSNSDQKSIYAELYKKLTVSLHECLKNFGNGVEFKRFSRNTNYNNSYILKLTHSDTSPVIEIANRRISTENKHSEFSFDQKKHEEVLAVLKSHPLVKRIYLPPQVSSNKLAISTSAESPQLPLPDKNIDLPIVGVIDTGIRAPQLKGWCVVQSKGFDEEYCNPDHGSNVASLIAFGQSLNGRSCVPDEDNCRLYDIWCPIDPQGYSSGFFEYFDDCGAFLDFLYDEIKVAKANGVRVFNMSLNFNDHVSSTDYSLWAAQIDEICLELDVQIVLSAGNTDSLHQRSEWPVKPQTLENYLLVNQDLNDRITQPADSILGISVAALTPPGSSSPDTPASYSRKGPGVGLGVKPDVAHYGGTATSLNEENLVVLDGDGSITYVAGTSFAAPLISRVLANINHRTHQKLSIVALKAVLIHHCEIPEAMNNLCKDDFLRKKTLRQFVGFGKPQNADEILVTDDNSITMVFESALKPREILEFDFSWPKSLVGTGGKCRGKVRLTLVYEPIISRDYGALFCRNNVEASLRQEHFDKSGGSSYKKKVDSVWKVKVGNEATYEKNLIENGLKWWPTKVYENVSKNGIGNSSNWKLVVSSQHRRTAPPEYSETKFCILLTVSDPEKLSENLYSEVIQSLRSSGVTTEDIRTKTVIGNIEV